MHPRSLLASLLATLLLCFSPAAAQNKSEAVATFAGGCFWCVESDFDGVPGVLRTVSGYTGGALQNPTYALVSAGGTGHIEAVRIFYDPQKVSYEKLLDVFWHSVDPTDAGGQFCDRGRSYETAIFANTPEQKALAEKSKKALGASGVLKAPVVTPIIDAVPFYPAEGYHQNYYRKNPIRYKLYRYGCGRDARLKSLWGKTAMRGIAKH
ncbi:MAG: peptide-methionine (S)-S-oxide reductase MsrA [Alphaproteobacteria bacterium]